MVEPMELREEEFLSVDGAPPCPECRAVVHHVRLLRRGRTFLFTDVFLEPCGHQVERAHYNQGISDEVGLPVGWSWEPFRSPAERKP